MKSDHRANGDHDHDIRILRAFVRAEEMRRERFRRELEAIDMAENSAGQTPISRWVTGVVRERWEEELHAVNRSLSRLSARLAELLKDSEGPRGASSASPRK
jgi:hypothetical protein